MAMIEAYRIGVELVLGGDLAAGIEALIPQLARLDDSLAHANVEAKELAAGLADVGGTAPGLGQAADAMERLNRAMGAMTQAADRWRVGGGLQPTSLPTASAVDMGVGAAAGEGRGRRDVEGLGRRLAATRDVPGTQPSVVEADDGSGQRDRQSEALRSRETAMPVAAALVQAIQPAAQASLVLPSADAVEPASVRPLAVNSAVDVAVQRAALAPDRATIRDGGRPSRPPAPWEQEGHGTPTRRLFEATVTPVVATAVPEIAPAVMERVIPAVALSRPDREGVQAVPAPDPAVRAVPRRQQAFTALRDEVLPQVGEMRTVAREGRNTTTADVPPRYDRLVDGPTSPRARFPRDEPVARASPLPARVDRNRTTRERPTDGDDPVPGWPSFRAALRETVQEPRVTSREPRPRMSAEPTGVAASMAASTPIWSAVIRTPRALPDGLPDQREAAPRNDPLDRLRPYHPPQSQNGAVIEHITYVQLDERTIARAVTRQQLRMMGGQVSGTLRPDPSIAPQYGAHLLES